MSKPIYEIPVNGGEPDQPLNFPPPAAHAMPANHLQPPPPTDLPAWPPFTDPAPLAQPMYPLPREEAAYPPPTVPEPSLPPSASFASTPPSITDVTYPPPVREAAYPPPHEASYPPPVPGTNFVAQTETVFAPPTVIEPSVAEQTYLHELQKNNNLDPDRDLLAALNDVLRLNASDLHVTVNSVPMLRIDGALTPVPDAFAWSHDKVTTALRSIMTPEQAEIFDRELELDFAFTVSANARFRVNFYQQRDWMGAAFRLIPTEIKRLGDLGVPETVGQFATLPRGLVLVTGPTGSGKSTTLAALVDQVNRTRADHIMTVEDPIEFLHGNHRSMVNQREVGHDTHSFAAALKHVLRQDPDVILIGELRDLETISVALTAAETGHLVFATLHTKDAPQTIDRIIDVFPPHQQGQVRSQLAAVLVGVVCQTLVKRANGRGRVVATELMVTTPAIANLIREGKTYQIPSAMQAGGDLGMHTMDRRLADLANAGHITYQAAIDKAQDVEGLKLLLNRVQTVSDQTSRAMAASEIDFGDVHSRTVR